MLKGNTGDAISANVAELMQGGHSAHQATGIALAYADGVDRAAGVCYLSGNSVLLLLRSPGAGDFPLTWCFPAGSIDEGETPEQAAIRESMEEVGHTPEGELRLIDWNEGFSTFINVVAEQFTPTLNDEHIGYVWVPMSALPQAMHPGCALTLGRAPMESPVLDAMDKRLIDGNGWFEVKANPISKAGVFPYSARQLGLDSDQIMMVLRPEEELSSQECIDSFKLIPWINDHVMLGPNAQAVSNRAMPAEQKGVSGVIGEDVFCKDGTLFANIKVFSSTLAALIAGGKKELSAGYRCTYDMTSGVWNGQAYDAVQRKIRGNHLALVTQGRMGPDVAVQDRLTFSLDAKDAIVADKPKDDDKGSDISAMTLADATKMLSELAPQVAKLTALVTAMSTPASTDTTAEPAAVEADDKKPAATDATVKPPPTAAEEAKGSAAMDKKELFREIAKRDQLAKKISEHVGTFDHAEMTLEEVVTYGCDKLEIKVDQPLQAATLDGYLLAKPKLPAATVALDGLDAPAKTAGSFVDKHLKGE